MHAVIMFYILSGFVITRVLDVKYMNGTNLFIREFYINRIVKLFPVYILAVFITVIIYYNMREMFHIPQFSENINPNSIDETFIKGIIPYLVIISRPVFSFFIEFKIIPQYWSVGFGVLFYFIAPLLFLSSRIITKLVYVLLFLTSLAYYIFVSSLSDGNIHVFLDLIYRNVLTNLLFFCFGGIVYFFREKTQINLNVKFSVFCGVTYVALICFSGMITFSNDNVLNIISWQVLTVIFSIPILCSKESNISKKSKKAIEIMGGISYPIYVIHYTVITVVYSL